MFRFYAILTVGLELGDFISTKEDGVMEVGSLKGVIGKHNIDALHNQDKVIKEALEIYKGKTLEFLDEELEGEVVEILSSEITETITKKAYSENAFKLSTNEGLQVEWEAEISMTDMMRFASYNIDLSRKHKIPFVTVIVTAKTHKIKGYQNPSLTFAPRIINLKGRDADLAIRQIEEKLSKGESINELQLIYLPLYGSKSGKTVAELLKLALKLAPRVAKEDFELNKLQSLLVLLCGSIVSKEEMSRILEDNRMKIEGNTALEILGEWRFEQGIEQGIMLVVKNLIMRNFDLSQISELTGLSMEKLREIKAEMNSDQANLEAVGSIQ